MVALNKSELKQLLHKQAQNTLTPDEQQRLDEWYEAFDTTQKDLTVFNDTEHENEIKQRLLNRILQSEILAEPNDRKRVRFLNIWQWSSVAAVLLMVIGAVSFWKFNTAGNHEKLLSFQTTQGQLRQITLDDGSQIWLNAGSKLSYPKHFDASRREVYLDGEAYFDVKHNVEKPFVVHTDRLTTNVLGTAFSVTAYKNMPVEAVTLMRGKVQVAHGKEVLGFLTPDKRIEYDINTGKSRLMNVDAASLISWKEGKLQFEDQDMQDISARLGRWYGYTFKFENNQIKNCRYTASFNNRIPLKNLLKVMKEISLVKYRIDTTQKTVTLLGTGCNQ
ncbi:FecR family protein [Mucilaginibacter jinjuensis]|uniref:FecR domain-containing protein n=1 Tax=Mucilaginibacter jinjuensis TaxID=1176721 RepID=A0ABY7TA58_9SPHI|nr:FecR family protein [Mucilaginibacter jinjuensis]WCT13400.1 FecR domain-containing protein [Mucilaginibacter jinjuensis]